MKPRYVRQIQKSDCGPIVIINVLKWAGYAATIKKHHKYLSRICRPEGFGTSVINLNRALSHVKKGRFWYRYHKKRIPLNKIEKHLKSDGAVILLHDVGPFYHFSLIIGTTGKTFTTVNSFINKTVVRVSRKKFKQMIRSDFTCVWLVGRYSKGEE